MITWNEWFASLKVIHWQKMGISYNDIGYDDTAFREMYDEGLTPSEAFKEEYDAMCASI